MDSRGSARLVSCTLYWYSILIRTCAHSLVLHSFGCFAPLSAFQGQGLSSTLLGPLPATHRCEEWGAEDKKGLLRRRPRFSMKERRVAA